jgi:hypothetical protein
VANKSADQIVSQQRSLVFDKHGFVQCVAFINKSLEVKNLPSFGFDLGSNQKEKVESD